MCFITWLAFYEATAVHIGNKPRASPKTGKQHYYRHYVFMSGDNPAKKMRLEAHADAVKEAHAAAGYSKNGQVTHRARHETAVDLRVTFNIAVAELAAAGGWDGTTKLADYAQLPTQEILAMLAGFGGRKYYLIVHALLDPEQMEEFKTMVLAFYPGVREEREWILQVISLHMNRNETVTTAGVRASIQH